MSPLSNANYNKIVNAIYTIVSDKLHRINEAGINKRMEQFRWNGVILSVQSPSHRLPEWMAKWTT